MSDRSPQDLPAVDETIRILNALLELDRPGFSALMLTRHKVNDALADAPGVQATKEGTLGALGLLQALYPALPDGRGPISAIVEGDLIRQFVPTMATGGIVPGPHGRSQLLIVHGGEKFTPLAERSPAPCLDPEKMNGFSDQFPGSDDPSPDAFPNPR